MDHDQIQERAVLCCLRDVVLSLKLDNVSASDLLDALESAGLDVSTGSTTEEELKEMEAKREM